MSRLTEIQKAIEELALEERRNFATGSMDLTLLRNENGPVVAQERVRQIESGEVAPLDGSAKGNASTREAV